MVPLIDPTQVIKAWNEAMQMMPVGSKWELVCPPEVRPGLALWHPCS